MQQPSITDYLATLENPTGVFRTLQGVEPQRDLYGVPEHRAGNSAAVFTYQGTGGERRFLKLYIRPNPYLREIYDYVERTRPPLLPDVRLLRDELWVMPLAGEPHWVDIVEGAWTAGSTLDVALARTADKTQLALAFNELASELRASEWAHGDLKPENIVVRPDGGMSLIDCDAMWIPAFAGRQAVELGTPGFRDPARTPLDFDKTTDEYALGVIIGLF